MVEAASTGTISGPVLSKDGPGGKVGLRRLWFRMTD